MNEKAGLARERNQSRPLLSIDGIRWPQAERCQRSLAKPLGAGVVIT